MSSIERFGTGAGTESEVEVEDLVDEVLDEELSGQGLTVGELACEYGVMDVDWNRCPRVGRARRPGRTGAATLPLPSPGR